MISLTANVPRGRPLTILCLGAHADDIEIGCGGTILRLLAERPRTSVHWLVASAHGARAREARRSAARVLRGAAARDIRVEGFRDGFLPYDGARVKEMFEELKSRVTPDLVFTHRIDDAHQDHRLISDLTWNTFRDHWILEYEIPKYDGDLGHPNLFVPLPDAIRKRKIRAIMNGFPTQRSRRWFTEATFNGLMRLRGIECAAAEGYAEGFHARKLVLSGVAPRR